MRNLTNGSPFERSVRNLPTTPLATDQPQDGCAHARAHNFLFEMRVGEEREQEYLGHLALDQPSSQLLLERHARYTEEWLQTIQIPPTFLSCNKKALKAPIDENQTLIRIENLNRLLDRLVVEGEARDLKAAFELFKQHLHSHQNDAPDSVAHGDALASLGEWLEIWNGELRDSRPVFAALADDIAPLIAGNEWAEGLRTRLGLAHHNPQGVDSYFALMHYSVGDVMQAFQRMPDAAGAFAIPTVLDSAIWPYFFPAPIDPLLGENESYGRAMPLEPAADTGQLVAELLHVKMDYRPEHLHKLGILNTAIPNHTVRTLRNAHLEVLRMETELYSFGAEIP